MSVDNNTTKTNKTAWKSISEIHSDINEKREEKKRRREEGESVVGHLTELRSRLFVVVIAFVVLSIVGFTFIRSIADDILAMGTAAGFNFVYIAPSEVLVADFKVSLIAALIVDLPLILFEIWLFAAPALTKREKLVVSLCLVGGFSLFVVGCVFCYLVAMPMMVQFLSAYNTSTLISSSISFQNYMDFVVGMVLTFGIVFEMPILAALLSQFGILKPKFMIKIRKYAILVIFIVAAIITPPDVVSQIMVGIPMIGLYELSILVCRITYRQKKEKEIREYGEDAVDMDDDEK